MLSLKYESTFIPESPQNLNPCERGLISPSGPNSPVVSFKHRADEQLANLLIWLEGDWYHGSFPPKLMDRAKRMGYVESKNRGMHTRYRLTASGESMAKLFRGILKHD